MTALRGLIQPQRLDVASDAIGAAGLDLRPGASGV